MKSVLNFFKVGSDETRLRILLMLYHRTFCVCEICEVLQEPQPKVSKHLSKLKDLGYVETMRKDQFIYYTLTLKDEVSIQFVETLIRYIDQYPVLKKDYQLIKSAGINGIVCKPL